MLSDVLRVLFLISSSTLCTPIHNKGHYLLFMFQNVVSQKMFKLRILTCAVLFDLLCDIEQCGPLLVHFFLFVPQQEMERSPY